MIIKQQIKYGKYALSNLWCTYFSLLNNFLSIYFFFVGQQWRLWLLMVSPTYPVVFMCQFTVQILFIYSCYVAMKFNCFIKHGKCVAPKMKWYTKINFCVWMWTTHTIMIWTWLISVINFGMCTKLKTGWVSTSVGGLFSFVPMALPL